MSAAAEAADAAAGITAALADRLSRVSFDAIPVAVIERAKDLLLDHLGVALHGARLPTSSVVQSIFASDGGHAESTLYGGGLAPARSAAFCNAAAAHAVEFDDTHDESLNHPGAVVIPAALAIAEARDLSAGAFFVAMIAGYEAQCRIGAALGVALIRRGFHPTASCGVYGATAAAGLLLGLNARALVSAFGSATSMTGGVMQFTDDSEGAEIKRLHAAVASERGVLAALLTAAGLVGPRRAIEGRYGFGRVFAGVGDLARIEWHEGDGYEIERISIKLYACCKLFHSLVEAVSNCRARGLPPLSQLVAIEPFGPKAMIDAHMDFRPQSTMAAQYSLPFTTAVALASDAADPRSFDALARADAGLHRIADLVAPRIDDEMEAQFPGRFAGGIRLRFADGTELSERVYAARSSPEKPISREDVVEKFTRLTSPFLAQDRRMRIVDAVAGLGPGKKIRELTALLRG